MAQGGSWASKAPVPTERMGLSSSVINDKIYVLGGMPTGTDWGDPASPILEVYDQVNNTWDTTKAPMQIGRNSFSCNTVSGKIYVFGGQSHAGTINISSVEEYDPLTDNWTFKTPMPDVRAGLTSCVVNDKIYIIGGWKYSSPGPFYHFREVWEYDPANDTWDPNNALMPTEREYLTSSVVDGKIYAFGGWDESVSFSVTEMYDPGADNWSVVTNMPEERVYLNSASVNNLIYILGGSPLYNVPPRTETWEYNPATDEYKAVTPMPLGMMQGTASEVDGKIYAFCGTSIPISFPVLASSNVFEFTPPAIINIPADLPTIQAGIDSAADGDIVLVADGTYFENINYKGKSIKVARHYVMGGDTNHINNTIIDGSQSSHPDSSSVVYFVSGEDTNSVLSGFTITGGSGTGLIFFPGWIPSKAGGGIFVNSSGAKIESNKIINNNISATGDTIVSAAGIHAFGYAGDYLVIRDNQISENTTTSVTSSLGTIQWGTVETCLFERNQITANVCNGDYAYGGGLYMQGQMGWQGAHIIRNNIIKDNIVNASSFGGGGGMFIENCSPVVTNNIISGNDSPLGSGGGIWVYHWTAVGGIPNPVFVNNTITNNSAFFAGGGVFVNGSSLANVKMINNILWSNSAAVDMQIGIRDGANIQVRYSDVQGGWPGEGNIDADPLFADTLLYNLSVSSPCVGWGTDSTLGYLAPIFDYDGDPRPNPVDNLVDMGAQESYFPNSIIKENTKYLPKVFSLKQNYPNPFNPSTTIEFSIPKTEFVTLKIYNLLGQEVTTLVSDKLKAGSYNYSWDAGLLASGVYIYKIQAGDPSAGSGQAFQKVRKMVYLK